MCCRPGSALKCLAWAGHRSEGYGHAPVQIRILGPIVLAECLCAVVPFIVPEVVVCKFHHVEFRFAGLDVAAHDAREVLDLVSALVADGFV